MMKALLATALLAVLVLPVAPAMSQNQTSENQTSPSTQAAQPVDVTANEMEIFDKEKKAVFRGSVDATRGTTNLKSEMLTIIYAEVKQQDGTSKMDATALEAKDNVTITTTRETITGDWAKYDPQTEKLVVGGNVKLIQGKSILTGNELQADLKTSRMKMTGGRVTGSFVPQ
ncbi:LptA/OstA family protein [Aestuariivirga sp.]|jgi:lipopolysaccharide export system protein LptA|uniref:LptA/OstA family protein n=1 Tax=Aestuariivirga sp. TaxID=2650926 RepID=UPI0037852AAB